MLLKLLPLAFFILGTGAGIGAAVVLAPQPTDEVEHPSEPHSEEKMTEADPPSDVEYVRMNNQFVIPIVQNDRVASLVVMSLSLETEVGNSELVYEREPKLRDAFLQVIFEHANRGGFRGRFTDSGNLDVLRTMLREVARKVLGEMVVSVLITDVARQDI